MKSPLKDGARAETGMKRGSKVENREGMELRASRDRKCRGSEGEACLGVFRELQVPLDQRVRRRVVE